MNYEKAFAAVKAKGPAPHPAQRFARITAKPWLKYLKVMLGNVPSQEAYGPAIAKVMARAKIHCSLPLGAAWEEKTY